MHGSIIGAHKTIMPKTYRRRANLRSWQHLWATYHNVHQGSSEPDVHSDIFQKTIRASATTYVSIGKHDTVLANAAVGALANADVAPINANNSAPANNVARAYLADNSSNGPGRAISYLGCSSSCKLSSKRICSSLSTRPKNMQYLGWGHI